MEGIITDQNRKNWVNDMKKHASILDNEGIGNCALYALAIYFDTIIQQTDKQDNVFHAWFSYRYRLSNDDKNWASADDHEFDLEKVNKRSISTQDSVNRHKFIKIYKCAVDAAVERAKHAQNVDDNDFLPILKHRKWNNNHSIMNPICQGMLREILILQWYLSLAEVEVYDRVTPLNVKNEDMMRNKLNQTRMYFSSYLTKICKPGSWLSNYFIEAVIKQVTADFKQAFFKVKVFPYIFATKKGQTGPFIMNFDSMHADEKESKTENNHYSRIVFVHYKDAHWFLLAHSSYPDLSWNRIFTKRNTLSVSSSTFTQLVNVQLESGEVIDTDQDKRPSDKQEARKKRQSPSGKEETETHNKRQSKDDSAASGGGSSSRRDGAAASSDVIEVNSSGEDVVEVNSSGQEVVEVSDTDSDIVEVPRRVPENAMIQDIMQRLYM
jgi:hypothetical protein